MGVKQWIFQRVSNLVFILFGIWLLIGLASGSTGTLAGLLSDGTTQLFLTIVLLLAGLNSMLAGWQIAGDYAAKINVSPAVLTGVGVVISAIYLVVGFGLLY